MALLHRKLLPEPNYDQATDCSDCGPTCPYDCAIPQFYWPPEPPPLPPSPTTQVSPYLIIIVAVVSSAVLFISYYLIMIRYCTQFRRPPTTQGNEEGQDFINEDHWPETDNPVWYITTFGLQPAVINSITVVKFKKGDDLIEGSDCSVCLSEFQDDESVRLLPKCNHAFHICCIDTWLRSHTNCPLCRAAIVSSSTNTISGPVDRDRNHGFGLNQDTEMENNENHGNLDSIRENNENNENKDEIGETQDSKQEGETMIAVSVVTESNSSDLTMDSQNF